MSYSSPARMMFATAAILAGLAGLGDAASAAPANCAQATTQAEIDACFGRDLASADRILNDTYQKLMKTLAADDKNKLRDAQRAWISFRDKHCAFVANSNAGGSIYPMIVSSCHTTLTVRRSQQLNARLHCQEGDMGCGS